MDPDAERRIDRRRAELLDDARVVTTTMPRQRPRELPLSEVVERVGKRNLWTRFLSSLVTEMDAGTVLELGASVGLSTAHLAAAARGPVHTVEGVPAIADIARETLTTTGLIAEVHTGRFHEVLPDLLPAIGPIDLAFIDGDHEGVPTIGYLEDLRPWLHAGSIVVLDDIRWSPGMRDAWHTIGSRPDTGFRVDLWRIGLWGPAT